MAQTNLRLQISQSHLLLAGFGVAWCMLIAGTGLPACSAEKPAAEEPIAHWSFDEQSASTIIRDSSGNKAADVTVPGGIARTRGVHGNALDLAGQNKLPVKFVPAAGEIPSITFSAWTRPTDLKGYREIFRQECSERILFSFQGDGSILSLGLNIGGYVECDARIAPALVLDGMWHHCAATFDGQAMRVYLDGKEIGVLQRAGRIATQASVPAFIGSSGGNSEFFQGGIDDLRIYSQALTGKQIAQLYRSGNDSLASYLKQTDGRLRTLYTPGDSFAETLAGTLRRCDEQSVQLDRDLVSAVLIRLKSSFPEDYESFLKWNGTSPAEYLLADADISIQKAEQLIELLVEYKPLTKRQLASQTPAQLRDWEYVDGLQKRFEQLREQGDSLRFSQEWIEILLVAGRHIQLRPSVSEAVAPYVKPQTPATRNLSASEAQDTLRRDWLHQAGQDPSPARIRDEIRWTRELANRILTASDQRIDFADQLAKLRQLEEQVAELLVASPELYFEVRKVKRAITFRNPVVDFTSVLFVDMPFPQGSEWPHETRHRLGFMAVPGARLLVLDGLSPAGSLKKLMPNLPLHGSFWRPDLSYDASKVLFCFKPHNEKSFHIYEINIDGTGLVQLTDGPYDDLDPIYLPDGDHILFSTSRGHTYVRCMPPTNAYVLARSDTDGRNIYLISRNNEPDYLPSVMDDGRVIYTRWEYTDKPLWRAQSLWSVHPDGTQVATFWGNQSVWPDLLKDARSIPGGHRVMFTGSAHHNWFSGSVGIIDPEKGLNFPGGLTKVTADVAWPESGNGPVDPIESSRYHSSGQYSAYYSPYPLSEQDFLVSANRAGKFVLYLMDIDGNRELIHEGTNNVFHALPVRPRRRPDVIADRVDWPTQDDKLNPPPGVIFSNNIYEGTPEKLAGMARFLRVLAIDPKTYTYWHKRPYISTGPVVSMVQSDGVKRVLGTVPIEEDGSVSFYAPSGRALHFQLLDERYRALQTMRSFTGVMPGEHRGCVGCHESHSRAPGYDASSLALSRQPSQITAPPWGEDTVSFVRYVQPTLDRYCGECHQGDGDARDVLDLTFRPGFRMFNEPYVTLTGRPTWGKPYEAPEKPIPGWGIANTLMVEGYDQRDPKAYQTPEPMTALSYQSRLIDLASSGDHYGVQVDPISLRKLIAWIDTMCPYRGDEEVRQIPDPVFQGVDWLSIRPKVQTAPLIIRPGPVD
ncbi:MAG: hypothetical protein GY903_25615 [Fuerstiella sp.]|nr:hypothetical protein [Fuerstiella sp.]MCP4857876.1 hypothetical protein [Fuerstiella sp.]